MITVCRPILPLLLAASFLLPACGGDKSPGRLSMDLSLPLNWEDRIDMGVLSAPVSTAYIGTIGVRVTCGGVERSWEAPWVAGALSFEGEELEGSCDILVRAFTAGTVVMEDQLPGVTVGSGTDVRVSLELHESEGFSPAGSLIHPRQYHSAVPLSDEVLIVGGTLDTGVIESLSVTGRSVASAAYGCSLNEPRTRQVALHDPANNRVFVFLGGIDDNLDYMYEVISTDNKESILYSLLEARKQFLPTIKNQEIFLVGGYDTNDYWLLNTLKIESPTLSEISVFTMGLPLPRQNLQCVVSGNFEACLAGMDGANYLDEVNVIDLENEINRTQQFLSNSKTSFGVTVLNDGRLLITGGIDGTGFLKDVEIIDLPSGQLSGLGGSLVNPRGRHTATLLPDNKVLIVGGLEPTGNSISAEIFDPATGVSRELPWRMTVPRVGHTATLLPDGRVLIVGGNMGDRTVEIFNPPVQVGN